MKEILRLKFPYLFLVLIFFKRIAGDEFLNSPVFEISENSAESSGSLGMLNFGHHQPLEDTTFDTQSQVLSEVFQDPSEHSTIGSIISENNSPTGKEKKFESLENKNYEYEQSQPSDASWSSRKGKRSQDLFSLQKILSKYSEDEIVLLNQYFTSFSLLLRKGLRKFIFKKYSPSHIRSSFAKRYVERFGGSKTKALLKLREFEKTLSLKHSAARRLFSSQFQLLTSTLNSAESLINLSEKWRYQPTYVSEPILIVNKASYNKLMSIRKKSKKVNIVLVSASSELIPKKYKKPDMSESYHELPKLSKTIYSFQESVFYEKADSESSFGKTQCKWNSSGKKRSKSIKNKLLCFFKSKKQSFFHIHYYDISNTAKFKYLMQILVRHKPNHYAQNAYPLIIIPVLIGIPQIDRHGSILGLNSVTEVTKRKKRHRKSFNNKKKKRNRKRKPMFGK